MYRSNDDVVITFMGDSTAEIFISDKDDRGSYIKCEFTVPYSDNKFPGILNYLKLIFDEDFDEKNLDRVFKYSQITTIKPILYIMTIIDDKNEHFKKCNFNRFIESLSFAIKRSFTDDGKYKYPDMSDGDIMWSRRVTTRCIIVWMFKKKECLLSKIPRELVAIIIDYADQYYDDLISNL
jgi:hypothetical protein